MFHTPAHKQPAALVVARAFAAIPVVEIEKRATFFAVMTDDVGSSAQIAADGYTPERGAGVCMTREEAEKRGAAYVARGPITLHRRTVPRAFKIVEGTTPVH
jgi:hypothetical protein